METTNGAKQQLKERILEKQSIYKDKFYQEEKVYQAKPLMFKNEQKYFDWLKYYLQGKKFIAFPQISLRSIVKTPKTWKTSNELYKYIDFVIFKRDDYMPVLAIEINGPTHETDAYQIARDESNKKILDECNIPIINIWEEEQIGSENFIKIIDDELKKINMEE